MKVLVITGGFPTAQKPAELVFVYNQVCQLSHYVDITIIVPIPVFLFSRKGIYVRERRNIESVRSPKFKVYFPPFYILSGILGSHFYAYSQFLSVLITFLLHRIKIDIIHGHFLYPEGFVAVILGKLLNKPIVNTAHRISLVDYVTEKTRLMARVKFVLMKTNKIICVSDVLRKRAIYFGAKPEKIEVIPNGVNTEVFSPLSTEIARKITGVPLNIKIVIFIGALIKRKGVHILLESIPNIIYCSKTPVHFIVLGNGILEKQLKQQAIELGIENQLQFIGAKNNEEIPIWINSADLLCLPSFSEGLPCILIEAISCGVPVVASQVEGTTEVINDENLGILVSPEDPEKLADGILDALHKNWDEKKIREYACQKYDWKIVCQQIIEVYRSLLQV